MGHTDPSWERCGCSLCRAVRRIGDLVFVGLLSSARGVKLQVLHDKFLGLWRWRRDSRSPGEETGWP